jgi:hypothetical protein
MQTRRKKKTKQNKTEKEAKSNEHKQTIHNRIRYKKTGNKTNMTTCACSQWYI